MKALRERLSPRGAELGLVSLGQLASALGTFAYVKSLTTLLGPARYGELALTTTMAAFAHVLVFMPLMNAQGRLLPAARERGSLPVHLRSIARLVNSLSGALGVAGIAGAAIALLAAGPRWAGLAALAVATALFNGVGLVWGTALAALRERRPVAAMQAVEALVRPGLAVLCVALLGRGPVQAQLGAALAAVAMFAAYRRAAGDQSVLRAALDAGSPSTDQVQAARAEALRFALPFAGAAVLTGIASYSDRWTLEALRGPEQVGMYAALFQIGASPPLLLSGVLSSFALPLAYEQAAALTDANRTRAAVRLLERAGLAAALLCLPWIALCALAPERLILLFSSPRFAAQSEQLWLFALAGTALGAGQIVLCTAQAVHRPRASLIPWALNAGLTLWLSIALGRAHGLRGVVFALAISNGVHLVSSVLLSRWLLRATVRSAAGSRATAAPASTAGAESAPDPAPPDPAR
jgi:O-antigen/teichoic acid export membrane protein